MISDNRQSSSVTIEIYVLRAILTSEVVNILPTTKVAQNANKVDYRALG